MKVARPELNLVQNSYPGSLETAVTVTVLILGLSRIAELVERIRPSCQEESCQETVIETLKQRVF